MRDYKTVHRAGCGDFIASVSGSGTDFDITLDDGTVLEEYNPDAATVLFGDDPQAGDLLLFGLVLDSRAVTVANAQLVPAAYAAAFLNPADQT